MRKPKPQKVESTVEAFVKVPANPKLAAGLWWLAMATLAFSIFAMLLPELRLWAFHQFAFLHLAIAIPLLLIVGFLLTERGAVLTSALFDKFPTLSPIKWAGIAFVCFMALSVYGSLLGDGQLSITRLAHVGDMLESNKHIPRGRFLSQKEPGTMLLHEGAFRIGMAVAGPDMHVEPGPAGQQARVERQLIYRGIAQWCYRILSSLAGALLVFLLTRFVRKRVDIDATLFWLMILGSGAWLTFFGYVENYAWVSLAMLAFLMAGLKVTEPPRTIPIVPILLFAVACVMHFMAVVLLPALIFLLWTMHFELRDREEKKITAPFQRAKRLAIVFALLGAAGYVYVEGWKGWISVMPLLPGWVYDGYALLSFKHGVDLLNLVAWGASAALVGVLFTKKLHSTVRENNQEFFLLLAAGASAFFAFVFSPNLGMARDWDIVTAALWPLVFYGAWRVARLVHTPESLPKLRASLLALVMLLLLPAVLVQAFESTSIERFRALLKLDRSRSAYGWENLALYYQRTKELDKRIDAWQEAVNVERNPRYLFNLGEALRLADRVNEADTLAIAAATMNVEFVPNLFYYAVAQAKQQRFDRTKAIVDTALALDPDVQYGKAMQAWANRVVYVGYMVQRGDTALALKQIAEYMQKDSSNSFWPEYRDKLLKPLGTP